MDGGMGRSGAIFRVPREDFAKYFRFFNSLSSMDLKNF